ncbi:MAG TPA: hypothetical protein P5186_21930 [Candidatus Paceibacterota bacterium]|nr:hypothetical protein [Candidatus Paceibacterota bacterium]
MLDIHRILCKASFLVNNPRAGLLSENYFYELKKSQWIDSKSIEQLQQEKIRRLLNHARSKIPFYSDYEPWQDEEEGSMRSRLAKYPILIKDAIRKYPDATRLTSGLPNLIIRAKTGGTTGEPIEVWHDRRHLAMIDAACWRGKEWIGISPMMRGVNVQSFGRGSWYGRIRMRLANKWLIDVFCQSDETKQETARQLLRIKPKYIEGYVSDTLALGRACYQAGVKINCVLTCGEMLYEHQRRELARMYEAKVSDYYGCNEVGSIAFECEMGRKHITDEHVIVEVVDDVGLPVFDQQGRILVTDLDNYLTPFIRYDVGDLGVLTREPCPCGRKLTVLKSLDGRVQDALVNASGDRLSTLFFAARFRDLKAIHRIQIIQKTISQVDLLYEGTAAGMEEELCSIVGEIRSRLGAQMEVIPRQVERLVCSSRGKCRLIVSLDEKKPS